MLSNDNNTNNSIQTTFHKHEKTNDNTVSLTQGDRFINYQNKIKKQTMGSNKGSLFSKKEGFSMNLKDDTDAALTQTNFTPDDNSTLRDLKAQYASTLKTYKKLQSQMKKETNQFIGRSDPTKNKFLGKNIRFREGPVCYVTKQGIARYYTDNNVADNTAGKYGCPAIADAIPVDIPWKNEYGSPGATIPTRPPLISGPPMVYRQACGNEGSNIYVNKSISTEPTYIGPFVNNENSGITYLGAEPPASITVQNPNFSSPALKNNTYQYYNDSSSVPGWTFSAPYGSGTILLNNSSAWGYPMPYPGGTQCACLQSISSISQTFTNLEPGTYGLSFQVCGRPGYSGSNPINLNLNGVTFYTVNIGNTFTWTPMSVNFTVSQQGTNTLSFEGQSTEPGGVQSSAITAISLIFGAGGSDPPWDTFDMCKTKAITQGYQYFGLTDSSGDRGYCVGTKDYVAATSTGTSYKQASGTALWSSATTNGSYAKLTSLGTLQVYNSSNQSVFSTPASTSPGSDSFWGCYQDAASTGAPRSIPTWSGEQIGNTSLNDCRGLANQSANSIYAVQASYEDNGYCFTNNSNPTDFLSSFNAGPATNCTKDSSGKVIGQGWSNAVYGTQPGFGCILVLQDDGNMCIYRGQNLLYYLDQNRLWSSNTNSDSLESNPNWISADGKYGTYWVYNGFDGSIGSDDGCVLYPGESIFSSNGKLQLIMQSDGNLVLYTSTVEPNERSDTKGNKISDQGGYALYGFDDNPNTGYNGILGYVDGAGTLHKYTDGSKLVDDSYTKYSSLQNPWYLYTINGEQYSQKSLADCKKTCTDDTGCGGITYDTQSGTCYYTESNVYLYDTYENEYYDTYLKNMAPKNPIYTNQTNNISGAKYGRYTIGDDMPNGGDFNLQTATAVTAGLLSQTEDQLNQLASEISKYNAEFAEYNYKILNQSKENIKGTKKYLTDYEVTSDQIKQAKKQGSNIDAILDDSNVVVLQENYNYALCSILAVGTVIISMVLIKK
uniref:Uncharacterized protein n=1 Tax=viral metagenome TaxID=1070528 RepID=A0A6C0LM79_9ZZZZ